jgi:hypothetical protein
MQAPRAPRRVRFAALAGAAVIVWGLAAWRVRESLRAPDATDARAETAALHSARDRGLGGEVMDLTTTYAVGLPGTLPLQELLVAAGVPRFLPARGLDALRGLPAPGPRLVLAGALSAESARAFCARDRAVITLETPATREVRALRLGELTLPLSVRAATLTPSAQESVLATDENGQALMVAGPCEGGVLLRLGVDLGAALLQWRQGDPARVDWDHDGNGELQPADLSPALPAALRGVPWADRLVDAVLSALDRGMACALPRIDPLPAGDGPVVVLTADQDYASDEVVRAMADRLEARGARATFLLTDPTLGLPADLNAREGAAPELSTDLAVALRARGHGLGIHPFPRVVDDVSAVAQRFAARHGARPLIARNHHLRWSGHLEIPAREAGAGVAMNLDWMPVGRDGAACVGFPGGSARPLRFVREGVALPMLQQPTVVDDYSLRVPSYELLAGAARALGEAAAEVTARSRREGFAVVVNAHPVFVRFAPQWLDPMLAAPGVRVITAERWLAFQLARREGAIAAARCGEAPRVVLPSGVTLYRGPRTSQ